MILLITLIHIIVCFFIIIVVLLQSGSAGDVAAAFGGMGSQTAFGPRGATTLLGKLTAWSTVLFMLTSITLSVYASRHRTGGSVLQGIKTPASAPAGQRNQPQPPTTPARPK